MFTATPALRPLIVISNICWRDSAWSHTGCACCLGISHCVVPKSCLPLQFLSSPVAGKGKAADAGSKLLSKEDVEVKPLALLCAQEAIYLKQPFEAAAVLALCRIRIS